MRLISLESLEISQCICFMIIESLGKDFFRFCSVFEHKLCFFSSAEKTRFMEFLTNTKEPGQFSLRKRYSQFLSQKKRFFFCQFLFFTSSRNSFKAKAKKTKDVLKLYHNVSCFFAFSFNLCCVAILKLTNNICLDNMEGMELE